MNKKSGWIAAISRGHNSGICLMKDGEIIFAIEEERLSRHKYDGGPYMSMLEILKYTDTLDYLIIAHTQPLTDPSTGRVDYTGDDVYTGLARKLGLIDRKVDLKKHPQVIDLSHIHHKLHAACAFYRSGFDEACAVICDGAGTFMPINSSLVGDMTMFEVESIFDCSYPNNIFTVWKHYGTGTTSPGALMTQQSDKMGEPGRTHQVLLSDKAGITKVYEAVTQYCGFSAIEAGKTMGLFPYGKPNDRIPKLFQQEGRFSQSNRNVILPTYPNAAIVNEQMYEYLNNVPESCSDVSTLDNRRDLAYACQIETQAELLKVIYQAVKRTGRKNVVLSGGYGLNCVANYFYLESLRKDGINLFVEPVSNDAGTAIGAALLFYYALSEDKTKRPLTTLCQGPERKYTLEQIQELTNKEGIELVDANDKDIVKLMIEKNIVSMFQGKSESGPRALGNRSILFDPTFKDGKDFVNIVKRREYFRPFAGSILHEHVHDWFDLRGMEESPFMMYAVNCQEGIAEKIPSIIHIDGTCRIQTVKEEQNPLYYKLIKEFYDQTKIPIVFNTSFNLAGEPLVETLQDAILTLEHSLLEYLYLPEYGKMIKVKNVEK
tara:strand:+ start:86077 stop:87885 length:1809 start_codon:yes stop_codon:yes gene_type:complete